MMERAFDRFAVWAGREAGRPPTFALALLFTVLANAAALVPTWREAVNTWVGAWTGELSLLLLALLQNGQNRQGAAAHLKADEVIRAIPEARDEVIAAEEKSADEIDALRSHPQPGDHP